MTSSTPILNVAQAQRQVRRALVDWDACNLDQADAGRQLLQLAVKELSAAEQALLQGGPSGGPEIYRTMLSLKGDLATLTGLIDACVSFHSGLLVRLGVTGSSYDASGHAVQGKIPHPGIGVQG